MSPSSHSTSVARAGAGSFCRIQQRLLPTSEWASGADTIAYGVAGRLTQANRDRARYETARASSASLDSQVRQEDPALKDYRLGTGFAIIIMVARRAGLLSMSR